MRRIVTFLTGAALVVCSASWAAEPVPLALETKIPLGEVKGRIDHFAVDPGRRRLFVAELGNDSVGVIDLNERKVIRTIAGFKEPQGIGYVPATDTLYVANAGDGSVRLFQGADLSPSGRIDLGDDADNIRVDPQANRVFIGYGSGALAIIDPSTRTKVADIPLKAHPEAFQLDPAGGRAFVNVPDARQIAVVDVASHKQIAAWPLKDATANFPMAIDDDQHRVIVAFRSPARLMAFGQDGSIAANLATCGDADDVFVDAKRHRIYVSCGEGIVDVLERRGAGYESVGRVPTVSGARTSLLLPEVDRLFVAVRASGKEPAAVWVLRPAP
jgi:YVTN family beta-propeller protein